jgi:hypothetical protein
MPITKDKISDNWKELIPVIEEFVEGQELFSDEELRTYIYSRGLSGVPCSVLLNRALRSDDMNTIYQFVMQKESREHVAEAASQLVQTLGYHPFKVDLKELDDHVNGNFAQELALTGFEFPEDKRTLLIEIGEKFSTKVRSQ